MQFANLTYNKALEYPNFGLSSQRLSISTLPASPSITRSNPQYTSFDITNSVASWYMGTKENYGIALKWESGTNNSVILISSDAYYDDIHCDFLPYLSISYEAFIPDGIYALKNVGNFDRWMDIQYGSTLPGHHMQQYAFGHSPTLNTDLHGLYSVRRVPNTSRYIIRAMINPNLTFGAYGTDVKTKEISLVDSEVPIADTFYMEHNIWGHTIRPVGYSTYVCAQNTQNSGAPGAPLSYLKMRSLSDAGDRARWELEPLPNQPIVNKVFKIKNIGTGQYLAVEKGINSNTFIYQNGVYVRALKLIMSTNNNLNNILYRIKYNNAQQAYNMAPICSFNGRYRVLDVLRNGAPLTAGQEVGLWQPNDPIAQYLDIVFVGDYFKIVTKDRPDLAITYNNGTIQLATYTGSSYQLWSFEEEVEYTKAETLYASYNWDWMFGNNYKSLTSSYGMREYNGYAFHNGIDVSVYLQPIYSVTNGTVTQKGNKGAVGHFVVVETEDKVYGSDTKLKVLYQHLASQGNLSVGQTVTKDTLIAYSGDSGSEGSYHLHFTVITNGMDRLTPYGDFTDIDKFSATTNPLSFYPDITFSFLE